MGEPEAVDVQVTVERGNVLTGEDRDVVCAQLVDAITTAGYEAAMCEGDTPIEPVLAATLSLRRRYMESDPRVAAHLLRMAAMRIKLPCTNKEADRLEGLIGVQDVLELAAAREELESLAEDVADLQGFPTAWFDAWFDLNAVTGTNAWPQR